MVFIRARPRHPWFDFRARRHRRPSLCDRSFWTEQIRDDENHVADATANRRPRFGLASLSLWHSPFGPRRSLSFAFDLIEQRGGFEQEATERPEMESILCFLRYLLLNFASALLSFGVFRVFRGYLPGVVSWPAVVTSRRCLSHEPWISEPDRCTEPPIAFGSGALEF